ncbi:hypothetical protein ACT3TP_08580 [Glutamicibacter sp. AOP38-B1-38]|uniref:hypothetical protein n=1 Tax=unclassified Glutamicibacter TaxID=2627139 RepID=UPI000BB866B6|nr:hypothetical protein [Glutamicibacter sp. BW80]
MEHPDKRGNTLLSKYSTGFFMAIFVSLYLAWNQRIPDPWGLYLILLSVGGFTVTLVCLAVKKSRVESREN